MGGSPPSGSTCTLAHELEGTQEQKDRGGSGRCDDHGESPPPPRVEESGNSAFFLKGKKVLDFLKPSLLKILLRMIQVRSSPGYINLKEQT